VPPISEEEAIARASAALRVDERLPARALLVHRLDRPGDYYLVVVGGPDAAAGVATVDASTGEVGTSAQLSARGPHLAITAAGARTLAGVRGEAPARLVWRPCAASRSPLYPFWEVDDPEGPVYVDQLGRVWHTPPWEAAESRG